MFHIYIFALLLLFDLISFDVNHMHMPDGVNKATTYLLTHICIKQNLFVLY